MADRRRIGFAVLVLTMLALAVFIVVVAIFSGCCRSPDGPKASDEPTRRAEAQIGRIRMRYIGWGCRCARSSIETTSASDTGGKSS